MRRLEAGVRPCRLPPSWWEPSHWSLGNQPDRPLDGAACRRNLSRRPPGADDAYQLDRLASGSTSGTTLAFKATVRITRGWTVHLAPVLRVADGIATIAWYEQLGFVKEWEHRFDPGLPLYVGIALGVTAIDEMPWGRDFEVADLDGNRLRIGTAPG